MKINDKKTHFPKRPIHLGKVNAPDKNRNKNNNSNKKKSVYFRALDLPCISIPFLFSSLQGSMLSYIIIHQH